jgi:hypothetical protein
VPWGATRAAARAPLQAAGLVYVRVDEAGDEYYGHGGDTTPVLYTPAGNVVAVSEVRVGDPAQLPAALEATRSQLTAAMGEPTAETDGSLQWHAGDVYVTLRLQDTTAPEGPSLKAEFFGPGSTEEFDRRAEAALPRLAPRWVRVSMAAGRRTSYDRETLAISSAGRRKVWVRVDFTELQSSPSAPEFDAMLTQVEYDCPASQYRLLAALLQLKGASVQSVTQPPAAAAQAHAIPPQSEGESMMRAVCGAPR